MLYLVDGKVKRSCEHIVDIQNCGTGYYILEFIRFLDGSVSPVEDCLELSFRGLGEYLRMQRTKLLLKFHYLTAGGTKTTTSIF